MSSIDNSVFQFNSNNAFLGIQYTSSKSPSLLDAIL